MMNPFKALLTIVCCSALFYAQSQLLRTGVFNSTIDVGHPSKAGQTIYDASSQVYSLSGSGANMWLIAMNFTMPTNQWRGTSSLEQEYPS